MTVNSSVCCDFNRRFHPGIAGRKTPRRYPNIMGYKLTVIQLEVSSCLRR
jgi:hypothetical protein